MGDPNDATRNFSASGVNYTPNNPAYWSTLPVHIGDALDTLAKGGAGSNSVVASSKVSTTLIDSSATIWPCDTTGGGFTITLPSAVGISGKSYVIKKTSADGNTLTIAAAAGQTIDGAATQAIVTQYQSYTVVSNGTNWLIV